MIKYDTHRESILPAILSLFLLIGLNISLAAAQSTPGNLDFETRDPDGIHIGQPWFIGQNQPSYEVSLDSNGAYHGKYWVCIRSTHTPSAKEFGNFMQSIDATPYRGRFVVYRAAMRHIDNVEGNARLWMRVDRQDSRRGFFSSTADRAIKSTEWEEYWIVGYVAPDAKDIFIGCSLQGQGSIGFDDVTFDTVSKTSDTLIRQFQMPETLSLEAIGGNTVNVNTVDIDNIASSGNESVITLKDGKQVHAVGNYGDLARYFEINK